MLFVVVVVAVDDTCDPRVKVVVGDSWFDFEASSPPLPVP